MILVYTKAIRNKGGIKMSIKILNREINVRVHHFLPRVTINKLNQTPFESDYAEAYRQPETLSREMYGFGGFMR
jgi:hypothetical protein